jgi:uncharacterized protein YndB with AHSA1/START domain
VAQTLAADTIQVRRVLAAPVARVWRVWTDPARAIQWSWGSQYDTVSIVLDCRPGGAWRHEIRDRTTGERWYFDGVFEQVEPERLLVHTFHFRSDRGRDEPSSLVRIEFTARGDRTEIAITHSRLEQQNRAGTARGWEDITGVVERLAAERLGSA